MGTLVDAICDCGYRVELSLGCGFGTFNVASLVAVHCRSCHAVCRANERVSPLACAECGSVDVEVYTEPPEDPADSKDARRKWVPGGPWRGRYLCPKYLQTRLAFRNVGQWD